MINQDAETFIKEIGELYHLYPERKSGDYVYIAGYIPGGYMELAIYITPDKYEISVTELTDYAHRTAKMLEGIAQGNYSIDCEIGI